MSVERPPQDDAKSGEHEEESIHHGRSTARRPPRGDDKDDDATRKAKARDFANRLETGAPHEGYSDEETAHNYCTATSRLSPQEYDEATTRTFGRMSQGDRNQLRPEMKQRSGSRLNVESDDPRDVARAAEPIESTG